MRWAGEGAGAPRITRHGIHRPTLIPRTWVVVPAGLMGTWSISWGLALPGSRTTEVTAQYSSPQAGIALPAQMSAVVVNAMGRRGRRRSQDHAPRHSPPDPHSPNMGRGRRRTYGDVVDLVGVGAPRITPRPTASLRVPRCSPSRCPGPVPGVTTRARIPRRPSGHRSCVTTGVGVRSR